MAIMRPILLKAQFTSLFFCLINVINCLPELIFPPVERFDFVFCLVTANPPNTKISSSSIVYFPFFYLLSGKPQIEMGGESNLWWSSWASRN